MSLSEITERPSTDVNATEQPPMARPAPIVWIWIAGIVVRLALMPFTVHIDAFRIYSRAHDAAYDGEWLSWGSQFAIQMLHNVWLWMIRPLLPDSAGIWSETAAVIGVGAQPEEYARFLAYPYLARALFLMKLPYLVADLATGALLTRFVAERWRARVLALWLLNPIVIFVSAVFGRHDSISILLVVLSAWLALRGRRYLGLLLLGLGAAARFFPALLAPIYVLSFQRSRRELVGLVAGLSGIWLVLEILVWGMTGSSPTLTFVNRYPHIEYLVDFALAPGIGGTLFLFPAVYTGLLLWFAERPNWRGADYVPAASAVLLVLFALTHFHPQYAVWLVPFLALNIYANWRLIGYHVLSIGLLVLFTVQFGRSATWELLLPVLGDAADDLPDPTAVVAALMPLPLFLGVVRSLLTAVLLWLAYRVTRDGLRCWDAAHDPTTARGLADD